MTQAPLPAATRLEKERADLVRAEKDIAHGQMRVSEQELRVEQLRGHGREAVLAEEILATLRATLTEWCAHREEILRTIRRLQGGES